MTVTTTHQEEGVVSRKLYNHISPRISDLDMEVIQSIPLGGNWKDIPLHVAKKSARISQIRESGGRTTYYGRLRYDLPSYTINTYFNRPGNGTFIHPIQDRLISFREAARLQSFPDSFKFLGTYSSIFKQIGNAVPPLLAKALGGRIPKGNVIDLFCGCGGLSLGLSNAGHNPLIGIDNNSNMLQTYAHNHPNALIIESDLSQIIEFESIFDRIKNYLCGSNIRILAGGPPCQGFSTAGKWNISDSRNRLVFSMIRFAQRLQPDFILIENVVGLKGMGGGQALDGIIAALDAIGYYSNYFILYAEQYGVPQRRRRLFIIASKNGIIPTLPQPDFERVKRGRRRYPPEITDTGLLTPITVFEAISDLPSLDSGSGDWEQYYPDKYELTGYQKLMRGELNYEQFIKERITET